MITKQKFKEGVDIIYFEDSTKVTNSYLLTDEELNQVASQIEFSRTVTFDWKCTHLRNKESYTKEIKAHNKLYKLGICKSHTIDADLEEDLSKAKSIIWSILGR